MNIRENAEQENFRLEEDVRRQLAEQTQGKKVYVVATGGYIHLAGAVDQSEVKSRIGSLVEKIPGVRMVTNHLRIRSEREMAETAHF
jgi:osmotically-inducible protein OsmY